jgi:ABC-type dipeptide/oligopeptide/nickel transport system permease component
MLLACVLVIGVIYFVATLTGDLLIAALNPRVRLARHT